MHLEGNVGLEQFVPAGLSGTDVIRLGPPFFA